MEGPRPPGNAGAIQLSKACERQPRCISLLPAQMDPVRSGRSWKSLLPRAGFVFPCIPLKVTTQ